MINGEEQIRKWSDWSQREREKDWKRLGVGKGDVQREKRCGEVGEKYGGVGCMGIC